MGGEAQVDVGALRNYLEGELAEIEELLRSTAADSAPVELDQQSVGRIARMDAMRAQAMAAESHKSRLRRVNKIKAALKRIEDGEFGYCSECGEPIPKGRLSIDPTYTTCVRCAR
jgi:DnaK suppressor protein